MTDLPIQPPYRIQAPIGQGSFGKTFLAVDTRTQSPCVVKQLSFREADGWKTIELFEREARVLAHLDHPRIPKFLGFYTQEQALAAGLAQGPPTAADQQAFLVQEHLPGQTLKAAIEAGRRFSEEAAIALARDVLEILGYLQSFSPPVIHRDIKPSNLILTPEGRACLVDFGAVSETLLHREGGGSTIVGTFGYMPPEQLDGRSVPGTDLYALGATLIYALSGREPGQIEKENLSLNFRPHVHISDHLSDWLARMTQPDWKRRFQTAREALDALDYRPVPMTARPHSRHARWILPALLLGLSGAGLAWVLSAASGITVQGELSYDGSAPQDLPAIAPRFWLRNEQTQARVLPEVDYDQGRFTLKDLKPGTYGLNVSFDADPSNPIQFPGDLRAWEVFRVESDRAPAPLRLNLLRLMHLTSPIDNRSFFAGFGRHCQESGELAGPQVFSWEPIQPGVVYDYRVLSLPCDSSASQSSLPASASGSITASSVRLNLPASPPGSYYVFELSARNEGRRIGRLMVRGLDEHSWGYRFRLR